MRRGGIGNITNKKITRLKRVTKSTMDEFLNFFLYIAYQLDLLMYCSRFVHRRQYPTRNLISVATATNISKWIHNIILNYSFSTDRY